MRYPRLFLALGLAVNLLFLGCSSSPQRAKAAPAQVLFVCEHGNVKSLMAMTYFNEVVQARKLPYRAISRGSAPDSDTVPPPIVAGLGADGFDVSGFHPAAIAVQDLGAAHHVVLIGIELPIGTSVATETWADVPAASVDFAAARNSIKTHISQLVDQLERERAH
jgi:arsenate reductase (thioredoxin)